MIVIRADNARRADKQLLDSWGRKESVYIANKAVDHADGLLANRGCIPSDLLDNHFFIQTSGSTGKPKYVIGSKSRAESLAARIHEAQKCTDVLETMGVLPLSYAYALVNQWVWAKTFRKQFIATCGLAALGDLSECMRKSQRSMLCLVASQIPLIKTYFVKSVFPGIIRVNFAGERFPQEELGHIRRIFPNAEVYNNYGCTEAMPRLTIRHAGDSNDATNIGRPLPGIELKTADDGRLMFRSPFGAVATINEEGLHRIDSEDWIETGDFGEQCADGSWRVLGRTNAVFKRFGEKISISAVINELRNAWTGEIAGYTETDATGAPSWSLMLAPEPADAEIRSVLLVLREAFTRPHWPIRIESMESLQKLPNGKIDIQALKDAEDKKLHWRQRI